MAARAAIRSVACLPPALQGAQAPPRRATGFAHVKCGRTPCGRLCALRAAQGMRFAPSPGTVQDYGLRQ